MPVFAKLAGRRKRERNALAFLCVAMLLLLAFFGSRSGSLIAADDGGLRGESQVEADRKSAGCITCHSSTDEPTMHPSKAVHLGCADCHGGDYTASISADTPTNSPEYLAVKEKAHVQPRDAAFKNRSTIPERAYTIWLKESADYIKFVNPGDLRVAAETCGAAGCHPSETRAVSTSMMTHSGFLWGSGAVQQRRVPL